MDKGKPKTKRCAKKKSCKKRKSSNKEESCSIFISQVMRRKSLFGPKIDADNSADAVKSFLDSLLKIVHSQSLRNSRLRVPHVRLETLQELSPELTPPDQIEIMYVIGANQDNEDNLVNLKNETFGDDEMHLAELENKTKGSKERNENSEKYVGPRMPIQNSVIWKQQELKRRKRTKILMEDQASNTMRERDVAGEIARHVGTLRKIYVVAEEINHKTDATKNIKNKRSSYNKELPKPKVSKSVNAAYSGIKNQDTRGNLEWTEEIDYSYDNVIKNKDELIRDVCFVAGQVRSALYLTQATSCSGVLISADDTSTSAADSYNENTFAQTETERKKWSKPETPLRIPVNIMDTCQFKRPRKCCRPWTANTCGTYSARESRCPAFQGRRPCSCTPKQDLGSCIKVIEFPSPKCNCTTGDKAPGSVSKKTPNYTESGAEFNTNSVQVQNYQEPSYDPSIGSQVSIPKSCHCNIQCSREPIKKLKSYKCSCSCQTLPTCRISRSAECKPIIPKSVSTTTTKPSIENTTNTIRVPCGAASTNTSKTNFQRATNTSKANSTSTSTSQLAYCESISTSTSSSHFPRNQQQCSCRKDNQVSSNQKKCFCKNNIELQNNQSKCSCNSNSQLSNSPLNAAPTGYSQKQNDYSKNNSEIPNNQQKCCCKNKNQLPNNQQICSCKINSDMPNNQLKCSCKSNSHLPGNQKKNNCKSISQAHSNESFAPTTSQGHFKCNEYQPSKQTNARTQPSFSTSTTSISCSHVPAPKSSPGCRPCSAEQRPSSSSSSCSNSIDMQCSNVQIEDMSRDCPDPDNEINTARKYYTHMLFNKLNNIKCNVRKRLQLNNDATCSCNLNNKSRNVIDSPATYSAHNIDTNLSNTYSHCRENNNVVHFMHNNTQLCGGCSHCLNNISVVSSVQNGSIEYSTSKAEKIQKISNTMFSDTNNDGFDINYESKRNIKEVSSLLQSILGVRNNKGEVNELSRQIVELLVSPNGPTIIGENTEDSCFIDVMKDQTDYYTSNKSENGDCLKKKVESEMYSARARNLKNLHIITGADKCTQSSDGIESNEKLPDEHYKIFSDSMPKAERLRILLEELLQ